MMQFAQYHCRILMDVSFKHNYLVGEREGERKGERGKKGEREGESESD